MVKKKIDKIAEEEVGVEGEIADDKSKDSSDENIDLTSVKQPKIITEQNKAWRVKMGIQEG